MLCTSKQIHARGCRAPRPLLCLPVGNKPPCPPARCACRDVATLGATCRALRAACSDGEAWRALLRRAFPASPLVCADLADYQVGASGCSTMPAALLSSLVRCQLWPLPARHAGTCSCFFCSRSLPLPALHALRQATAWLSADSPRRLFLRRGVQLAYQLEANGVVPELACSYSRAPFESEVLGLAYQVGAGTEGCRAALLGASPVEHNAALPACADAFGLSASGCQKSKT